jgi:hypothetical protein
VTCPWTDPVDAWAKPDAGNTIRIANPTASTMKTDEYFN